ncbi:glutamine synthetase family protein [Skermanella mucosa]|uniref:glutamine synthetase family protein n=1 Tax=Skermanella mucosa TaxID=1789672 RepID=UPI00192BEB97|nr:glutamine synthetase family protein [Skermanella mucosa]UEM19542.1 glutamine synthetase family protein [Skermanella mucosa]
MNLLSDFIQGRQITEVECLVPDMSGIARGKILPAEKFLRILRERGLRMPEAIFIQTVTGEYPDDEDVTSPANSDIYMRPDENTIRMVPWYAEATAQVISDCDYADGSPVDISPRWVLKRVLELYDERGWQPIVAPELEFFLVQINKDPDYPLVPPVGRSGRTESGRQAYGIDAVNEFDPIFEDVYDYCEAQRIDIDTLTHEAGAAQIEINFNHGDALELADQVFLFKRTVRETAIRHNVYATFMAKPMQGEPGSAMHVHQSVVDKNTGENLFSNADGEDTPLFLSHIAGLQKYLPSAMPLLAPNVNSYRRLIAGSDAPINVHWGRDNRTTGFRVPVSQPESRRVENRVAGADANPYLALAASLACGYIGMIHSLEPTDPVKGSAHRLAYTLPRHQSDAITKFNACKPLREIFGERFVAAVTHVKQAEYDAYQRVISSWERENLLLNV